MRIFKRILPLLAGLCFFLAVNALLNFFFIPYQFTRMKIHNIETNTYDDLILGSSHGCAAIDPAVLSETTGRTAFNAAAGGQYPRDNYYLLQDACREHAPSRVIFEYDPAYWIVRDSFNRNARYQLDVMRFSPVRLSYFKDLCLESDIRFVLMPWFMYAGSYDRAGQNAAIKRSEVYRTYGVEPFVNREETCREDGFTAIADSTLRGFETPTYAFTQENAAIVQENQKWFEKMVRACREQGLELVVVTTPLPPATYTHNTDFYTQAHEKMQSLADTYGFAYLDYVAGDEAAAGEAWAPQAFCDGEGHMHMSDAARFTRAFAERLP